MQATETKQPKALTVSLFPFELDKSNTCPSLSPKVKLRRG